MSTPVNLLTAEELERHAQPDAVAGLGALGTARGNLPLEKIDLRAVITGLATRTELIQGFRNPYPEPLEATYIFPLPDRAAVTALRMEAGDRVVEGVLKERGEARADYEQAVAEGRLASIAEQERGDVFTLRVGNIMPGERVVVRLSMAGLLPFEDGAATFRFPLVVAPRYIPGAPLRSMQVGDGVAHDTDAVPDASRITPPVLLPGFPNPVQLSARVEIDPAGLPVPELRSSLHVIWVEGSERGTRVVQLALGERANRDFVLRLHFGADDAIRTSLAVQPDETGEGTFALTLVPPNIAGLGRPKAVALLLDRSGSMDGWKIVAARRAAARIIDSLRANDRFEVWTFDHTIEHIATLPDGLKYATDRNRFRAVEHLAAATARGGTEMLAPLREAVDTLREVDREIYPQVVGLDGCDKVLILVTDGQVGNEDQILRTLAPDLADIRVHTVGVDTAVHEGFLHSLAALGGGRCELVESEDRLDEAMRAIHHRIATPLVTNLRVVGDRGLQDTICPARLPDLFPGAPVVITGRTRGTADDATAVTVTGRGVDGTQWQQTVPAAPADAANLAAIWARMRIRDLEDRYAAGHTTLEQEIIATSLRFSVLSRFTAFVALDTRVVNEGGQMHRVVQPVEIPQGWTTQFMGGSDAPMVTVAAAGVMPMAMAADFAESADMVVTQPVARRAGKAHAPMQASRSVAESAEAQPWNELPATLRTFVIEARAEWRRLSSRPFEERRDFLMRLAADIKAHDVYGGSQEPWLRVLRELVAELSGEIDDPVTLQHRWLRVGDVLDALAGVTPQP